MTITPKHRAPSLFQQMAQMHRWKSSALAAAVVALSGLYAGEATALALGRVAVLSALGEPLRAEIELPQITAAEADSLRTQIASPEMFRAQGMEYTSAAGTVQVQLQRRQDGNMVLRLTSTRPINEPFVDLVLDASWGSGQVLRSYTLLFDPPTLRKPAPSVTTAAQSRSAAPAAAPVRAPVKVEQAQVAAPSAASTRTEPTPRPARKPRAATPAPDAGSSDTVTVRPGDTAGRLAAAHRPAGVSLDQMLVALLQHNPEAFVDGNVNRLRSGSVLQLPSSEQAQAVSASEARQLIAAQSRDFNQFRNKLASTAPSATVASAGRAASGKVQTEVQDQRPSTTAPDKLTLSKGAMQGRKNADEELARKKQEEAASTRLAELSRNIAELKTVSASAATAAPAGKAPAKAATASAPGVNINTSAPLANIASAPASAAVTPAASATVAASAAVAVPASAAQAAASVATPQISASAPVAAASAAQAPASTADENRNETAATAAEAPVVATPVASAPAPAPRPAPSPAPVPAQEPSFMDSLLEDPLPLYAGGGLLALLLVALKQDLPVRS